MRNALKRFLRHPHLPLLALFLLALIARLLFLGATRAYGQILNDDAHDYLRLAGSLQSLQGFALEPGQPSAFRPFGYPLLLAVLFFVTGPSPAAAQGLQALLGALLVLPTYGLARRLAGPVVALLAGLGVALHPILLYQPALVAPGSAATLLEMSALWFAALMLERTERRRQDGLGFLLTSAGAAFFRPEFLLVTGLLTIGLMAHPWVHGQRILPIMGRACVVLLLVVGLPLIRNALVLGEWVPLPTMGGAAFWGGNHPDADGGRVMPSAQTWLGDDPPAGIYGWPDLTEKQSQTRFNWAAVRWVDEHLAEWVTLVPRKLARAWSLGYVGQQGAAVRWGMALGNWILGACVVAGTVLVRRRYRPTWWLVFAPVVAWFVNSVVFYGSVRLTAPILPVFCILAAVAVEEGLVAARSAAKRTLGRLAAR